MFNLSIDSSILMTIYLHSICSEQNIPPDCMKILCEVCRDN